MKVPRGFAAALAMLAVAAGAQAAELGDSSYRDAANGRVLREWVVVAAPRDAVWRAFTADDVFGRWTGLAVVHITPGNGGLIEFGFLPTSKIGDPMNVRNRIDIYLPDELLAFHNEFAPDGGPFDPAAFATVRTLLRFEDAGPGRTRVTETVVGFGEGATYDRLYDHLHGGNAEYLGALAAYFTKGGDGHVP